VITLERILLPTDLSECSERARSYACELAKRFEAELHLLHVVQPISLPGYGGPVPGSLSDELFHPEEGARRELEGWNGPAFEHAKRVVRSVITGTPFVEIVRYARNQNIDLIVMGTHGRSGLAHALLGSVTEKVVRKSPCPVLTVRPEGHQFIMP
jgi:nucleotide-binding universal stress UspA family protein